MIAHNVNIGQIFEENSFGRLDKTRTNGGSDTHRIGNAAYALYFARVGQIDGQEFELGRAAKEALTTAQRLVATFEYLEFDAIVTAQETFEHRQRGILD